jgi:hypothetical protein
MSEERARILKMVADGKISVKEAEELLDALTQQQDKGGSEMRTEQATQPKKALKYLRVKVDSHEGDNVNVKVPLGLLRAGIKLSALMPKHASDKVRHHLHDHGVDVDLNDIKPQDIEQIIEHLRDMEVNVDSKDGDIVRVFCE